MSRATSSTSTWTVVVPNSNLWPAADRTKYDLAENRLLAEYSIRYGGYGGIAYHHVADTYVALFSHFATISTFTGGTGADVKRSSILTRSTSR